MCIRVDGLRVESGKWELGAICLPAGPVCVGRIQQPRRSIPLAQEALLELIRKQSLDCNP